MGMNIADKKKMERFKDLRVIPFAGAMLIFSVSIQF